MRCMKCQENSTSTGLVVHFVYISINAFVHYVWQIRINIPDRIIVYQYLPEDYESANKYFRAEACICYDFSVCKKVIIVILQYECVLVFIIIKLFMTD